MSEAKEPSREEVIKGVRVLGTINVLLGGYMLLGAALAAREVELPGVVGQVGLGIGIVVVLVTWGLAFVSGIGLLLRARWGRSLGLLWGRVMPWILMITFGLAHGLKEFLSLTFAVLVLVCFYGFVIAQNLARDEFDAAFE